MEGLNLQQAKIALSTKVLNEEKRTTIYALPELQKFMRAESPKIIYGSLFTAAKGGFPVKIVFVRNRNKKIECLYLLSTACSLSDMVLPEALQSLMALFVEQINNFAASITDIIKSKVAEWINSQSLFVHSTYSS